MCVRRWSTIESHCKYDVDSMRRLKWIKKKKQSSCFMHQITADSPYQTPSIYTYGLRECIWYYSLYSSLIFAWLLGVDWKKSKTIGSKMMSGGTTEEWRNQHRRLMCEKTNLIERWWHVMTYAHTGAHIASANIVDIKLKCCAVMHNEQYMLDDVYMDEHIQTDGDFV